MISTASAPKENPNKHYIDLNESVYESKSKSNPYLRAIFRSIASKETKMKKREIDKVADSLKGKTIKQAVKIADKHIGSRVVFYYGVGDEDPTENEFKLQKPVAVKKKRKTSKKETTTQETLESNMKKQTKRSK